MPEPNIPPAGLFALGALEFGNRLDVPEPAVAPPPPNNPPPGVLLELDVALFPALLNMDPPPEPPAAPNNGLLGVLLPPDCCPKLKAMAWGEFGRLQRTLVALNGSAGRVEAVYRWVWRVKCGDGHESKDRSGE